MLHIVGYLFLCLLSLVVAVLSLAALFLKYSKFQHWKKQNVPHITPKLPFGNFGESSFTKSAGEITLELYQKSKNERYFGIYFMFQPQLMIRDPELIKQVFVSDFQSFHDRGIYTNEDVDPLAGNLFNINGASWRNLRVKLTPTFTSGKMKMMFQSVLLVVDNLQRYLDKPENLGRVFEIKDLMARFTTDVIGSSAFGIEVNSLENPGSEFRQMGRAAIELTTWESVKLGLTFSVPWIAKTFKMRITKQQVEDFFVKVVKDTMNHREQTDTTRNDFLQLLIELKNKGHIEDADSVKKGEIGDGREFTFLQAVAQAFLFFVAGFETSSTTLQFTLYELAKTPELQDKTRAEILQVLSKHDNKLSYDALMEMEYLEQVVSETLRKYPPVPFLNRECTKEFKIPDSDLILKKGDLVTVPVVGLHHDPQYYPDPDRYDPDRFTEKAKSKRHHYVYLPFGEGPRNCIGNRFGLMQTKAALVGVLSKSSVEFCNETPAPIRMDPKAFLLSPAGGVPLRINKL